MMQTSSPSNRYSFIAFLFVSVFIVEAAFLYPKWKFQNTEATISWDVMGYYLYLPSYFYDDISKLHNLDYIINTYHPVYGFPNAFQVPSGNYVMKYSMGMALMYVPFFAIAHVWASLGGYAVDGFSYPYQVMLSFGSLLVSVIGLWFARKCLLKYFSDKATAVALLVLVLATNYFNYVSYVGPMTHNYLFTIYVLVTWLTITWYEKPSVSRIFFIGLLCGLATVTRPTEIIILIIPFAWGVRLWLGIPERIAFLWKYKWSIIIAAIGFALPILPQLLYWRSMTGEWLYYSYQEQGFSWKHPHFYDGILTYKNGWLVYTPVMTLALVGFVFLFRTRRNLFWTIFFFSLVNIYIVYSWDIWWYGGSFGSRAMVQSYALLLFPLAAFFEWAGRQKITGGITAIAVLFCVWLNLLQTYQAHAGGIFEAENMTRAYYWRIFGKTKINPLDRKLIDTPEELPAGEISNLKTVYEVKSPLYDSLKRANTFSENNLVVLTDSIQFSKSFTFAIPADKNAWYRVSAMVFFPARESDVWTMTQFNAKLSSKGKQVKQNMVRIQRVTEEGSWQPVFVDIKNDGKSAADSLQIYFWNSNGNKNIYIDDLKVEEAAK
jgi:hypothetical protein